MWWVALVIAVVAVIAVAVIYIIYFFDRKVLFVNGIPLRIQTGADATTDTMTTGGNNLYIVGAAADNLPLTLTIANDKGNQAGTPISVFNGTEGEVTLKADSGMTITGSTTVAAGAYAVLVFTDATSLQRLQ